MTSGVPGAGDGSAARFEDALGGVDGGVDVEVVAPGFRLKGPCFGIFRTSAAR